MPGMLGPRMSASTSPIQPPICWSANARFTLTVDLPTPPLPLPTAMTWRIPGSFSEPAGAWDDAPGACWSSSCGSVVCIPQFLSFSPGSMAAPTPRARCRFPSRERRVAQRLAGSADLRLRPSERRMWRHARTGHFSISERPAAVSAGVVEREELAVDVEQGNLLALHLDQTRLTRPDLSCPRCLHKVSHRSFPSITFLQPTHAGTRSNGGSNCEECLRNTSGSATPGAPTSSRRFLGLMELVEDVTEIHRSDPAHAASLQSVSED